MFLNNVKLNQDLSGWNISSGLDFLEMFYNAQKFNQNLCAWGSQMKASANIDDMFKSSSCPEPGSPSVASICRNCTAPTEHPTIAPTEHPTIVPTRPAVAMFSDPVDLKTQVLEYLRDQENWLNLTCNGVKCGVYYG
jgi:hypothetical protein